MKYDIKQSSRKSILLLGMLWTIFSACKKQDWYDLKGDKKLVVPSSVADFQAILDNSLINQNYPALGEIAADGNYIIDANINNLTPSDRNAYTWSHEQSYINVPDWMSVYGDGAYTRIFYTNTVLDGLKKLTPGTGDYNNVKGEALFIRAKNFYELSQVFAPPYLPATAASELGIPLRLEADINIPSKRSTLQETYDQVINDLKEAETLLPVTTPYVTRGTRTANDALLARIYLSMEDYANALVYANKSLALNSVLLDFNTILPVTSGPLIPNYNKEVLFHSTIVVSNASYAYIDKTFYDSYEANDLRKTTFFMKNADSTTFSTRATYFSTAPWSGLANDEVYLIRAECYARAGNPTDAMADLNTLLKNRYVNIASSPYVNKTASSADDALVQILTERRKELVKRGLRWSDLRRLNRDERFKVTLTRVVQGKTYTLEPNSYKYTFPIPDDIVAISGIQQNTGW